MHSRGEVSAAHATRCARAQTTHIRLGVDEEKEEILEVGRGAVAQDGNGDRGTRCEGISGKGYTRRSYDGEIVGHQVRARIERGRRGRKEVWVTSQLDALWQGSHISDRPSEPAPSSLSITERLRWSLTRRLRSLKAAPPALRSSTRATRVSP